MKKFSLLLSLVVAMSSFALLNGNASASTLHKDVPSVLRGKKWVSTKSYNVGRGDEKYTIDFSNNAIGYTYPGGYDPVGIANIKYTYVGKNRYHLVGKHLEQGLESGKETMNVHILGNKKITVSFHAKDNLPKPWHTTLKQTN
ncbi:hypothetical protein [Nicoliella lavandulae]|uniref:DUF4822 domain-containing protein n=1 Tax=Nicoliella lavandulae TaxID=3082954 RepID=A0ABU8SLY3_9LACO